MQLLERYILKTAFSAFLACLVALTGVIWITQALKQLDLLTSKGQTILVFLTVTGLSLPALITVISPVALFVATIYTLNKLNSDSELIVMTAAGVAPGRMVRPFLALGAFGCVLIGVMTFYAIPASLQELRDIVTKVRADFVSNIVKEGQFISLETGVTFHFRERSGSALLGILMQDQREPGRAVVYLAERGQPMEANGQSYLVLEQGSVHRQQPNSTDSSIISFERYAIDLAALNQEGEVVYKPSERSTTQLLFPDEQEGFYKMREGRFRSELHDRLSGWLYPLAMILAAFAALGEARTTRQGRSIAILAAVLAVGAMRIAGFSASSAVVRSPAAIPNVYVVPLVAIAISLLFILQGPRLRAWGSRAQRRLYAAAKSLLPHVPRLPRLRGA